MCRSILLAKNFQLPQTSLVQEYKIVKVIQANMLQDSPEDYVSGADIKLRSVRKWKAEDAVELEL